jgi:hypothetical protein
MEEYPWFQFYWMGKGNDYLWAWIDCKVGKYWYVFIWRKRSRPSMYRSLDATPPMNDERGNNHGRWFFGARADQ